MVDTENVPWDSPVIPPIESAQPGDLLGVSLCPADGPGGYFPLGHLPPGSNVSTELSEALRGIVESANILIFHNAKHDLERLRDAGYKLEGKYFFDTMLMFHMLHEEHWSKDLTATSQYYGGNPKNRSEYMQQIIDTFGWWAVPANIMDEYSTNDAEITRDAFKHIIFEFLAEYKQELWTRETKFTRVIANIERHKVKVDLPLCAIEAERGRLVMESLQKELGFNPNSNKDLNVLLIDRLELPVLKKSVKTGKPSFDRETMEQYEEEYLRPSSNPIAQQILRYRGWSKAVSSYYEAYIRLERKGELQPNFKIHGTRTGRLSCERPNLQQIPKEGVDEWNKNTKKAFLARDGFYIAEFDYSQLELRLAACKIYAREPNLLEIFNDGRDVFTEMAETLGWTRFNTKTFVYATMYGGGITRIKNAFNIEYLDAKRMRDHFFKAYPNLRKANTIASIKCKQDGYVSMWTGRRRHFLNPDKSSHKAFNAIIQGGAFEIVKDAMIRLDEQVCSDKCKMVLQVHDSVWFEIATGYNFDQQIIKAMTDIPQDFGVPFVVEKKVLNGHE